MIKPDERVVESLLAGTYAGREAPPSIGPGDIALYLKQHPEALEDYRRRRPEAVVERSAGPLRDAVNDVCRRYGISKRTRVSKDEQLTHMLGGEWSALAQAEYEVSWDARFFTITPAEVRDYLASHPDEVSAHILRHEKDRDLRDIPVIWREKGRFFVGYTSPLGQSRKQEYPDALSAVVAHLQDRFLLRDESPCDLPAQEQIRLILDSSEKSEHDFFRVGLSDVRAYLMKHPEKARAYLDRWLAQGRKPGTSAVWKEGDSYKAAYIKPDGDAGWIDSFSDPLDAAVGHIQLLHNLRQ